MRHVLVGNDVVDLEDPRTEGRATDERFVGRVFDVEEQEAIAASTEPDLELWTRWAAKEAGFKVISKRIGSPPPFIHRLFKVSWTASTPGSAPNVETVVREGTVRYEGFVASVTVTLLPGRVHAVAFAVDEARSEQVRVEPRVEPLDSPEGGWNGSLEDLLPRFSERERDAVYSRASAAVRVGARADLAGLLGVDEERLEIVCAPGPTSQRPPTVLLDGKQTDADVSLSHDGRWIAWAMWVGGEGSGA